MFLKLKEFGGISFRPEESVSLSIVHVRPYLFDLGLYTAVMESMDSITRSHPDKSTSHIHTHTHTHTHTHKTDDKHIQPHTAQSINERKSAESNLVTAQSKAYEPLRMVE